MVGRCISYWNSPFLGDMLVFRGVRLEHFTNIRTTYMLECSPQEVLFFKSQTKAAGIQQIFQLQWLGTAGYLGTRVSHATYLLPGPSDPTRQGETSVFPPSKISPRKRPQRCKKMRLADFSNVPFGLRLVGSSFLQWKTGPLWLFRIYFWILLLHIMVMVW